MSTINAANYGDGTDSTVASALLEGTAKVSARINGTNTPASLVAGYNSSSVTDNGTGSYTLTYTNALSAATYAAAGAHQIASTTSDQRIVSYTTSTIQSLHSTSSGSADAEPVSVSAFGSLA